MIGYTSAVPAAATLPALLSLLPRRERATLRQAHFFAREHLSDIRRRTGEDYAQHGLEVAAVLQEAAPDAALLCVALLHDLPLHPHGPALLRKSPLRGEEQDLILQMHSLRRLRIDQSTADLDQAIHAFAGNERLLHLRMAHRVNDARHLDRFAGALRREVAHETLHMYTAIAGRLGMSEWRADMEDICFRSLHPATARRLERRFEQSHAVHEACLRHAARFLRRELAKQGLQCELQGRIKGLYSTYRKMIIKRRQFEELTDRLALRIITPNTVDCYRALAVVHAVMHPVPGKLKDYIGAPKENGYRSIHTVVYPLPGVTELPLEIQIRTMAMHRECLYGSVAHDTYKSALYALTSQPARVNLFRNLEILRAEARSPRQFEQALRKYFSDRHLAAFDHRNNLYHLQRPATALDFAWTAYPRRWMKIKNIRVNGREQPLSAQIRDGDIVEVRFGISSRADPKWIKACLHAGTKQALKKATRA
jgi:(p)ppGpp synthase/HD superfamily hydrolase